MIWELRFAKKIKKKGRTIPDPAFPAVWVEATPGFEPGITVLQTVALPLGYVAQNMRIYS
jgi:hypothetical protein